MNIYRDRRGRDRRLPGLGGGGEPARDERRADADGSRRAGARSPAGGRRRGARAASAAAVAALAAGGDRPDPVALLEDRRRPGSRSSCPSATAGWPRRRSPSTAAPRCRWRPTSPTAPVTGIRSSCAATRTSRNFGLFASPERDLLFDVNDFDETLPGPLSGTEAARGQPRVAGRSRGFARTTRGMPSAARSAPTGSGWPSTPRCVRSTSTTHGSTRRRSSRSSDKRRAGDRGDRQVGGPPRRPPRAAEADRVQRGRATDRGPAAGDHHPVARPRWSRRRTPRPLPRDAPGGPARPARPLRDRRLRDQGRRCRQRRSWRVVALLDGRRDDDPLFLQIKEAEASVSKRFLPAEPTATTASGSSPASAGCRPRATSSWAGRSARTGATVRPPAPGPEGRAVVEAMTETCRLGRAVRLGPGSGACASGSRLRSPAISATTARSPTPSRRSPSPTPTRPNGTTPPCSPRSAPGACRPIQEPSGPLRWWSAPMGRSTGSRSASAGRRSPRRRSRRGTGSGRGGSAVAPRSRPAARRAARSSKENGCGTQGLPRSASYSTTTRRPGIGERVADRREDPTSVGHEVEAVGGQDPVERAGREQRREVRDRRRRARSSGTPGGRRPGCGRGRGRLGPGR